MQFFLTINNCDFSLTSELDVCPIRLQKICIIKKLIKMGDIKKILMGAVSIAVGVEVGTWAYNKFLA